MFPQMDFGSLVYPGLRHPILEAKQKDLLFSMLHGVYRNRERLFEQQRAENPLCLIKACLRQGLAQNVEHIFCNCYMVKAAWQWTRGKLLELLADEGTPPVVSNMDILMMMFPKHSKEAEFMFILGNHVELVDRDAMGSKKELLVSHLVGQLRAKIELVKTRAVTDINLIL